eukprot:2309981-Pleurochrysis_carterae.AAC.2
MPPLSLERADVAAAAACIAHRRRRHCHSQTRQCCRHRCPQSASTPSSLLLVERADAAAAAACGACRSRRLAARTAHRRCRCRSQLPPRARCLKRVAAAVASRARRSTR